MSYSFLVRAPYGTVVDPIHPNVTWQVSTTSIRCVVPGKMVRSAKCGVFDASDVPVVNLKANHTNDGYSFSPKMAVTKIRVDEINFGFIDAAPKEAKPDDD